MTRNEEALTTMVSSTIVEFHNEYAAQPVKKFQDKATAVRRTAAVLDEAGMEFDERCQLRQKPNAEEAEIEAAAEKAEAEMNQQIADACGTSLEDIVEQCDNEYVAGQVPEKMLEFFGEFGLGDSEESAECPHCGINHRDNGYARHDDDYECDERIHACLACGGEWGPKIQRLAKHTKQPRLSGERLSVVGGKDAANPFREGSKSHAAFDYLQKNPGSTYEELKAAGVRMRAISHSKKQGWIRAL